MEMLVTSKDMQQFDDYTINHVGIPSLVLMERAALTVVDELYHQSYDLRKVAVVCGYGNNGGDGVAIARLLKHKGIDVTIYFVGNPGNSSPETLQQIKIAQAYHVPITTSLSDDLCQYSTIIDAIFGIGLTRDVKSDFAHIINHINQSHCHVVSVDIPSGICADSGQIMGVAIKADLTITLGYKKRGLVLYPGADHAGRVITKDIGIYAHKDVEAYSYQIEDLTTVLPHRPNYANKGTFGKVLVIAGSDTMCGAAYFAAKAAYRTGAGLVQIYTPKCNRDILFNQLPEALITTYIPDQIDEEKLKEAIKWATVIVIGPGMGVSGNTYKILSTVLAFTNKPVIIDADGLNTLSQNTDLIANRDYPIFVTPHLGEMARLTKTDISLIAKNLIKSAIQFTKQYQVTCILKDTRTIISTPKSDQIYINQSGNNGMATGGSGDVLTGILAGLIAQGINLDIAAPVSVYLHGLAGDNAANDKNQYSMMANDIIEYLPEILKIPNNQ